MKLLRAIMWNEIWLTITLVKQAVDFHNVFQADTTLQMIQLCIWE